MGLPGRFRPHVESDLPFRPNRRLQHLPQGAQSGVEFPVATLFHFIDFAATVLVRSAHGAELNIALRRTLESMAIPCSVKTYGE